ncbi:MAG: DNA polymerase III subunit beta [Anaerorhabdus sp.]
MNFKISKSKFYNALQIVTRAISPNSPLPHLTGVKIDINYDNIVLTGSCGDISIQLTLNNEIEENLNLEVIETGCIVIDSRYITEIVRKIDNDIINFEILDGTLIQISGYHAEFKINGMFADDYPVIDFSIKDNKIALSAEVLKVIINQTCFAASDKEVRPLLTGVNFNFKDNLLECVATDSFRLARKRIPLEADANFSITIPAKSLNEISKSLLNDDIIEICVYGNKAQFNIGNVQIQTRLIDGNYPETNRLVPTEFSRIMVVDTRSLLNAIDRASFIKNNGISIINLNASSNGVIISSKSYEIGSSKEELAVNSYEGEDIEISFSGKYVFDAIRALSSDMVKIEFCGEMKPFVIHCLKDDSILQLVLPVRTY